ncbi:MAG: hypothetical protein FWG83_07745 [Oscillospiraceae bacterium]|nr:hypothetical protein [Oscillospiraceae bacterium]
MKIKRLKQRLTALLLTVSLLTTLITYPHGNADLPVITTVSAESEPPAPDFGWYYELVNGNCEIRNAAELLGFAIIVNTGSDGCTASPVENQCTGCKDDPPTTCDFKDEDFQDKVVKLNRHIDLAGIDDWTPIGTSANPFKGTFDGNGYAIFNLTIDDSAEKYDHAGLFGYIESGCVKNLTLVDAHVKGNRGNAGGIAGMAFNAEFSNCYVISSAIRGSSIIGGANFYGGGIVGKISGESTVERCYTEGDIKGTVAGGLVGSAEAGNVIIVNSYSEADVEGLAQAGGILGKTGGANTVMYTYFAGTLTAGSDLQASETPAVGGIVGYVNYVDYNEPPAIVNNAALNESIDAGDVPTDAIGRVGGLAEPDRTAASTVDSSVVSLDQDGNAVTDPIYNTTAMINYTIENPDDTGNAMFMVDDYAKWYNNNYAIDDMEVEYVGGTFAPNDFDIPMGYNPDDHGCFDGHEHYNNDYCTLADWKPDAVTMMMAPNADNKHGKDVPFETLIFDNNFGAILETIQHDEPRFWLNNANFNSLWSRCNNFDNRDDRCQPCYNFADGNYDANVDCPEAWNVCYDNDSINCDKPDCDKPWHFERTGVGGGVLPVFRDLRAAVTHTVTFSKGHEHATGSMDSVTVMYGDSFTLPENEFTRPPGYAFTGWKLINNDGFYDEGEVITALFTSNVTFEAQWRPYIITFEPGNAEVTPQTTFQVSVELIDLEMPDEITMETFYVLPSNVLSFSCSGYSFVGWTVDGVSYNVGDWVSIAGDLTVTPWFKQNTTVTVTPPDNIIYGETLDDPIAVADKGNVGTFAYHYMGITEIGNIYNSADKPTLPGMYAVTATLVSDTHHGSGTSLAFRITPDQTPPTGTITVRNNSFTTFLNTTTFGLFFKGTVDVTVTGADVGSGVDTIEYLLSDTAYDTEDEVKAVTDGWKTIANGGTFTITANWRGYIYARITDNADNVRIIRSDGVVRYADNDAINPLSLDVVSGVIVVHNNTDSPISTRGLYISDDEEDPFKWQMPSFIIRPGQSILIRGSDNDVTAILKRAEVNFDVTADIEVFLEGI